MKHWDVSFTLINIVSRYAAAHALGVDIPYDASEVGSDCCRLYCGYSCNISFKAVVLVPNYYPRTQWFGNLKQRLQPFLRHALETKEELIVVCGRTLNVAGRKVLQRIQTGHGKA